MIDFSRRDARSELMDHDDIPQENLFLNYRELDAVNSLLGGYRITLKGLKKLLSDRTKEYAVLDVGCGGGDMVKKVFGWGRKEKINLRLSGIDLNAAAIAYSEKNEHHCSWIRGDIFEHLRSGVKYDVIISTLFMHHFAKEKIVDLLRLMTHAASTGIIINDLQRHPVAYHSIRLLTKFFSKSYLVKHDAPLSVLRSYSRNEWKELLEQAEIKSAVIQWQWAFRFLIVIRK